MDTLLAIAGHYKGYPEVAEGKLAEYKVKATSVLSVILIHRWLSAN